MINPRNNLKAVEVAPRLPATANTSQVDQVFAELEQNGIVVLHDLIGGEQLAAMQRAFNVRLKRVRWNDVEGYEREDTAMDSVSSPWIRLFDLPSTPS